MLQMFLHLLTHLRREGAIEVAGGVLPNVLALYDHENHLRFGLDFFNCGTSFFCSMMRARCNRTFTDAMEMPSASADWFTLSSSTSRSRNTSRQINGRSVIACCSNARISCRSSASEGISRQSRRSAGVTDP